MVTILIWCSFQKKQLNPKIRFINYIANSKKLCQEILHLKAELTQMQDRYLGAEQIVSRKMDKKKRKILLASPLHRATRCLQHASFLLLCLTITLHCLAFIIRCYIPELILDEYDALPNNATGFREYSIQIDLHRVEQKLTTEGPNPKIRFGTKFPFLKEQKPVQGWRNAILDFLGSMLWLTHNQVTVDTKRAQFPSGRH